MLQIMVDGGEFYDEERNEFIQVKPRLLTLEHSLLSLSKWEAKWKKPFLTEDEKTPEEYLDYIKCMTITQNVDPLLYKCFSKKNFEDLKAYIHDPRTATTITSYNRQTPRKRIITSELIYYWMIANNVPPEYEKWHLNRLLTLIRICTIENNTNKKKMGRSEIHNQNRQLNAARRAKYNTRG
jgi:hypothetical protein